MYQRKQEPHVAVLEGIVFDERNRSMAQEEFDHSSGMEIVERSVVERMERAAIDTQIATAKKFPLHSTLKEINIVKENLVSFATSDEETASSCFYTLPRGGKVIQGPSVRLAEFALTCYGNMHIATRIADIVSDSKNPHVIVQAVAHDLERNIRLAIEKRRRIIKKKSKTFIDEDDIQLAVNSCSAIARRDATFGVIPQAIVKYAYDCAKKVAVGDVKSLAKKRQVVVDKLKQMGVPEARILAVVECEKVDDIDVPKLEVLIGLGTALKDGDTTIEDAFPSLDAPKAGVSGLKETLKNNGQMQEEQPEAKE